MNPEMENRRRAKPGATFKRVDQFGGPEVYVITDISYHSHGTPKAVFYRDTQGGEEQKMGWGWFGTYLEHESIVWTNNA